MSLPRTVNWVELRAEIRRRWLILTFAGIYLAIGGLFAFLIYQLGWDQTSTRWAAQIYPLPAARVNGEMIWLSAYYRRLRIFEQYNTRVQLEQPDLLPEDPIERKKNVLDELISTRLLKQEAQKAGIAIAQEEIDQTFNKLVEENGGLANFEKVLADFYGLAPAEFSREFVPEQLYRDKLQNQLFTQVHVRHIVLKDEAAAREILERVKKGEDFAELAKNFSQDLTTREAGGDLGWIRRGQLVKPFEDAAFALTAGATGDNLVPTDFGYHILKVDERKDGAVSDKSFSIWFEELKAAAKVKRYVPKEPKAEPVEEPSAPIPTETSETVPPSPTGS